MTSQSKKYPTRVEINHIGKTGWIVFDQIRTIDKQLIIKTFDILSSGEIEKVKMTIKEILVDWHLL